MISLRKPLCLETAIDKPLIGIRVVSKEIATDTPTEIAMLRYSVDDKNKTNSDADSSYRDPDVELLSRESKNDRESKAPTQLSFESENAILLRCVKALEEHNQLLERIHQLQAEHNTITE
jgi:hypothetical protein